MVDNVGISFEETSAEQRTVPVRADLVAMMGHSRRGPTDRPRKVLGKLDFETLYGAYKDGDTFDLALAYNQFLQHGGAEAYMLRLAGNGAAQATTASNALGRIGDTDVLAAYASNVGAWGNDLSLRSARRSWQAVDAPLTADNDADNLPTLAGSSQAVIQWTLESLIGLQVGDVLDVLDPDSLEPLSNTGADPIDPIVVAEVVPAESAIRFIYGLDIADLPAGAVLRTNSNHLGVTRLAAEATDAVDYFDVLDPEGFEPGSVVTLTYVSHNKHTAASGRGVEVRGVVDRVVGTRVYLTAALSLPGNTALPAATKASIALSNGDVDSTTAGTITITEKKAGPAGNARIVKFIHELDLVGVLVTVEGNVISITFDVEGATATIADIIAAVEAHSVANALIEMSATDDAMTPAEDHATQTWQLSGGAYTYVVTQEFELTLIESGRIYEADSLKNLSMQSAHRRYVEKLFGGTLVDGIYNPVENNASPRLILVPQDLDGDEDELEAQPRSFASLALSGGADGSLPEGVEYIGSASPASGMHLLDTAQDLMGISMPGITDTGAQQALIDYCEARGDVYAILDMPASKTSEDAMVAYLEGELSSQSSFAQLCAPWGVAADPRPSARAGDVITVPPSAAVLGLTVARARIHAHRSAGNQVVKWLRPAVALSPAQHNRLNDRGITCIVNVGGQGLRLFGDRTLGYRIVDGRQFANVRRWINYFKRTVRVNFVDIPFEPANRSTMATITDRTNAFLGDEWAQGALYPDDNEREAYAVQCDDRTTTRDELRQGIIIALVAVSVSTPAEKIIFRVQSSSGGVAVSE